MSASILAAIASQHDAALAMLGKCVDLCPEPLWLSEEYPNRFWHIAYHALFYSHYYLQGGESDLHAWEKHRPNYQYLGPRPWVPQDTSRPGIPYTRAEILEYHALCLTEVKVKVPALDLAAPSGFSWLPFDKFRLQLYNLRHLAHHTGQLMDRLRNAASIGIAWVR